MAKKKAASKKPVSKKKTAARKKAAPSKKRVARKKVTPTGKKRPVSKPRRTTKKGVATSRKNAILPPPPAPVEITVIRHTRELPVEGVGGGEPPEPAESIICGNFVLRQNGQLWFCMEQRPDNSFIEHDRFKTREKALKHMRNEHS